MPLKTIQILVSSLSTGAGDGAASSKTKFDPFKSCKLILVVGLVKQKKNRWPFCLSDINERLSAYYVTYE